MTLATVLKMSGIVSIAISSANPSTGSQVSDFVDWEGFAIDTDLTPFGGVSGKKRAYLPIGWTGRR